jgi:hypothetical protein
MYSIGLGVGKMRSEGLSIGPIAGSKTFVNHLSSQMWPYIKMKKLKSDHSQVFQFKEDEFFKVLRIVRDISIVGNRLR